MSRTRRTARVAIEDLFASLGLELREAVLESLQTIHRLKKREESKAGEGRPPIQQQLVNTEGNS
jgi:hypothetical protein